MSKFVKSADTANQLQVLIDGGAEISINGVPAVIMNPNSVDAAQEKHVPVIEVAGDMVKVTIGSVLHPSLPEHYIQWIYLQTNLGGHRKDLNPGDEPIAVFKLVEGEVPITAYEHCNLHDLWKKDI